MENKSLNVCLAQFGVRVDRFLSFDLIGHNFV